MSFIGFSLALNAAIAAAIAASKRASELLFSLFHTFLTYLPQVRT